MVLVMIQLWQPKQSLYDFIQDFSLSKAHIVVSNPVLYRESCDAAWSHGA